MPVIFSIKESLVDVLGHCWEYMLLGGTETFILEST